MEAGRIKKEEAPALRRDSIYWPGRTGRSRPRSRRAARLSRPLLSRASFITSGRVDGHLDQVPTDDADGVCHRAVDVDAEARPVGRYGLDVLDGRGPDVDVALEVAPLPPYNDTSLD